MSDSCRTVPESYPPSLGKMGEKALRNAREPLDNTTKYMGKENGFLDDRHSRGKTSHHNTCRQDV